MKNSENYQFNLPELADQYDLEHWNANTRLLDTLLKTVNDKIQALDDLIEEKSISLAQPGQVIAFAGDWRRKPDGWVECDGHEYPVTEFPRLFNVIGRAYGGDEARNTFKVPDYGECVLVGYGRNLIYPIANHDIYNIGEFKDDAMQQHVHVYSHVQYDAPVGGVEPGGAGTNLGLIELNTGTNTGRVANVTRGKRVGIMWLIKY
jgi:microcystin-dependent protein